MMEHVGAWLSAYRDGELNEHQAQRVREHLEQCATCRAELAAMERLSSLLSEASPKGEMLSADQAVAQVKLRLPRQPEHTLAQRVLSIGWKLIPVALVVAWTFMQVAALVSSGISFLLSLAGSESALANLLPTQAGTGWLGRLLGGMSGLGAGEIYSEALRLIPMEVVLNWRTVLGLAIPVVMALAFWSWLASWWLRSRVQRAEA